MKIKNIMIRLLAGLAIFMIVALPSFGEDYLIMQKRGDVDRSFSYLRPSTDTRLRQAGMKSERIKRHFINIDAVTADLSEEEVQKLSIENKDLVLVRAGTMLYHSRTSISTMEEMAVSDIPWHVLKAHPLQDYAEEENADTESVLIFVLDTGVDKDHPELKDNLEMELAKHFKNGASDEDVSDSHGHGTQVIGTIIGTSTGAAPSLYVVPIRAATDEGGLSVEQLSAACDYIMGLKQNQLPEKNFIINLSYNTGYYPSPDTELSSYFETLFGSLEEKEILFIGSAGNDGVNSDSYYVYPTRNEAANYVAAASVGSDGKLSWFSDYGKLSVEVAAPGSSIYTTNKGGTYVTVDGTSFASPFTAGIAGQIWALDPSLEYWEVRNLLINAVSGQEVETSFIKDYSGSKDDYLYMTPEISVTAYEDTSIDVIAGKPFFPAMVTDRPYAPSPANGEEHVAFDSDLEWDSHYEVASYDIWFGNSADSLELISDDIAQRSYSLVNIENLRNEKLLYDTDYYWQINTSADVSGDIKSFEGAVWRFKTLTLKAYDNYPVNGAQNIATSITLSRRSDISGSTYDIYLSPDIGPVNNMERSALLASGISSSSVEVSGLAHNTKYYWRIVTHHSVDPERLAPSSTVPGDILSFTTLAEKDNPDMSHSGGGGCSTGPYLPASVLLLIPLLLVSKRK